MALNAAEHIRIKLDHGFGDGLHVLVIATDEGDLVLWSSSSSSKLAAIARMSPAPLKTTQATSSLVFKKIYSFHFFTFVKDHGLWLPLRIKTARTFVHSIALTIMLGLLVAVQQYLIPGIIPSAGAIP
jgi:hypothetical protein